MIKKENIINSGYWVLKIAKVNSQQEKPICPNCKKLVPGKHKKSPIRKNKFPQKFRATRYPVSSIARYFYESLCILVTPKRFTESIAKGS